MIVKKLFAIGVGLFALWKFAPELLAYFKAPTPAKERDVLGGPVGNDLASIVERVRFYHNEVSQVPTGLVLAVIQVESGGNPKALGAAGEIGLMQILPLTFTWIMHKYGYSGADAWDVDANVLAGMLYLVELYRLYGSWESVLHSYNVGPGAYDNGKRNYTYVAKVMGAWVTA